MNKPTRGQTAQALEALHQVETYLLAVAANWARLTPEQRDQIMDRSPVVTRFLVLTTIFREHTHEPSGTRVTQSHR